MAPRSTAKAPKSRTRSKKQSIRPEVQAAMDTLEESINPGEEAPRPARAQKPGPKKVLSDTSKIFGDGVAAGVLFVTRQKDARANLSFEEAQSIGHPVVRLLARRVPAWLKPFLPKSKLSADDAADLEEILATLGKWTVRLITIMVSDVLAEKEHAEHAPTPQQTRAAQSSRDTEWERMANASLQADYRRPAPEFNPFNQIKSIDLGVEVA